MSSRASQDEIDEAALAVVGELRRDDAAYLEMLDGWEDLHPGARAELVATLKDAFSLALKSPPARRWLLRGEIAALVERAVDNVPVEAAEALVGSDPSTLKLREAIRFTPLIDYRPDETPFGKKAAEAWGDAKSGYEQAGVILEVLGLATPYVAAHVRTLVGDPSDGQLSSVAYLWRCLVGTTKLNEYPNTSIARMWKEVCSGDPDLPFVKHRLFDHEKGPLAGAFEWNERVFKWGALVAQILLVHYAAWDEGDKHTPVKNALDRIKAIADVVKAVADLVPDEASAGRLIEYVRKPDGRVGVSLNPIQVINLVADAIALAASAAAWWDSRRMLLRSTKSKAFQSMAFDAIGLAVSVAGMVLGAEFILVGLGLYAMKSALANWDWFVAEIPLSKFKHKAGPHVFLEKLLEEMDDHGLRTALAATESHGSATLKQGFAEMGNTLDTPILEGHEALWDVGGAPSGDLSYTARNFVKNHWGLSGHATDAIVRPSREVS